MDVIFGTHLQAQMPLGEIGYGQAHFKNKHLTDLTLRFLGRVAMRASPHETKDSIVIGGQLINNLQQIVSRRIDPLESAVVSVLILKPKVLSM